MKITYARVYDKAMRFELTEARYKSVVMKLDISDDLVFIYGMDAGNKNQGEGQEMLRLLMEEFKGRKFGSSPPVSDASKHILDKFGIGYEEYMR